MENATRQAMARKRWPVRCRNCGYVTTPVSGFCPNCLEPLPLGRQIALAPILAVIGLLALGALVAVMSSDLFQLGPAVGRGSPSSPSVSPSLAASPSLTVSPSPSVGGPVSPTPTASPSTAASSSPTPSPMQTAIGSQNPPEKSPNLPSTATSTAGSATGGRRH
jgi:hypothetical protein